MKRHKTLLIIIAISLFLRLIYLTKLPPSLNWDEVSHGYNAYSILKTGKDEWGVILPSIFRAYGDYKLPVYVYATAISVFIFGLNAFAVRLPSAIVGVGTVMFTYFLAIEIFGNSNKYKHRLENIGLLASVLVAIEPWSLFLSRGAFEANLALMLFVGGVYFLYSGLKKPKYLFISAILLGLSIWTYNSYRVFSTLMIGVFILIFLKEIKIFWQTKRKLIFQSLIIFTIFFLPMFIQLTADIGQARYFKVAIINEGTVNEINEKRASANLSPILERIIYNKGWYFIDNFISNWFSHYSPDFQFFKGGDQYQFSVQGHGLLYLVNLPFLLIGLVLIFKNALNKQKTALFLLLWFLLAPIPASITRESPHVLRTITMLPIPMLLSSYGFIEVLSNKNLKWFISKKWFIFIYLFLIMIAFTNYIYRYANDYRINYSWSWQYGYKEVVNYALENYQNYDKIVVTKKYGEPHEFFLFFMGWDPEKYRNDPNLIRFYQSNWYWVDRFDKFYFVNDWEIPSDGYSFVMESGGVVDCGVPKRCLLITSPGNIPSAWNKLREIYFLDGKSAFEIYDNSFSDVGLLVK